MDYYKTLGLTHEVSKKEIMSTYREILKQYSTTSFENPKTANQFKLYYNAYYILSDEFRRQNYDKYYLINDFESEEYKTWHKNQFKKRREQQNNSDYSFIEVFVDDFIFEGIGVIISEAISSISD